MSSGETPERAAPDLSDLVGTSVADRYDLTRLVSRGANTAIFDASDRETGRTVSLKLLRPAIAASPSFRDRFDDEMRAVAALSHPNIVALYDWGMAPIGDVSTGFVVTETLTGGSLRDLFDRGRRLSPSQALTVGLDACRGLDHAHRRKFVHTELTPSKIVFGNDRRVRIADFGLARLLGESAWERPESVDNHVAWYSAPEQAAGGHIDGRTDVYALCLTLHEAVTGELPFKTDSTVATLAARVGRLMPVSADLGPLASVFERAGRPDIDERSTAAQLGKGLVQAASKLPRPEPLPLLSTGLFDMPPDQLRDPDDPTGGITRPGTPIVVVPATPDEPAAPPPPEAGGHDEPAAPPPPEAGGHDPAATEAPVGPVSESSSGSASGVAEPSASSPGAPDADEPSASSPVGQGTAEASGSGPVEPGAAEASASSAAESHSLGVAELDDMPDEPYGDVTAGGQLVILPVDSELDGGPGATLPEPAPIPGGARVVAPDPVGGGARTETAVMPVAAAPVAVAPTEPPPRRRRFPWKMVLAVLVAGALIVLGVLASRLFETPVYTVPDLVGVPEAEARNEIAPYDWELGVDRERSDLVPVIGQVIRTAPGAGVELAEGEPFLLVVSEGPVLRELPELTGLTLAEAQNELLDRDLEVSASEAFDEDIPPGVVISWSVPGDATLTTGSLVLPGTTVELVVSQGPEPRSVPNLVALSGSDARAQVEDLGLVFDEERQEFSDEVPAGFVISQAPDAGSEVERGDTVWVVVSRGPDLVTFPDLSGVATYEEAAVVLSEAGFVPILTFGDAQGDIIDMTIDGEEPQPGTTYRRGTEVEFRALAP